MRLLTTSGRSRQCWIEPPTHVTDVAEASPPADVRPRTLRQRLRRSLVAVRAFWQFLVAQGSSSLTRRIVILNVAGLLALVVSILYLSQFRAGSHRRARAEPAGAGRDHRGRDRGLGHGRDRHDHDRSRQAARTADRRKLRPAWTKRSRRSNSRSTRSASRRAAAAWCRRRARRRASIDRDGTLLLDTRNLYGRGDVLRFDLVPVDDRPTPHGARLDRDQELVRAQQPCRLYKDLGPANGARLSGGRAGARPARRSSSCASTSAARSSCWSRCRCSASARCAACCCSRRRAARSTARSRPSGLQVLLLFVALGTVMVLLSMLLARTIAGPVRRLAEGAERVRRRIQLARRDPRLHRPRRDEIGDLSGALRDMTNALYSRIEAIESFAADVAHELKNPLTSLRSAVETMPLAKTPESRARLLGGHRARREAARPPDHRHLRREPPRRRVAASGRGCRSISRSCSTPW